MNKLLKKGVKQPTLFIFLKRSFTVMCLIVWTFAGK